MNIYQNGEFSKNLHKLTKYQSLAATADMSKQSLYSQKIKEYRSKLDKIGSVQTGGANEQIRANISQKIGSLVSIDYKEAFFKLRAAHDGLMVQIQAIGTAVDALLQSRSKSMTALQAKQDELDTKIAKALDDLSKSDAAAAKLRGQLTATSARYQLLLTQSKANPNDSALREELAGLRTDLDRYRTQGSQMVPGLEKEALDILRQQLAQQTQEVIRLQTLLAERGNTGNTDCDARITEILTAIDTELSGRTGDQPENFNFDKLTDAAQQVLSRLTTQM
jgi:predicted  nucleic acid-binding Zn-ribbon protein